MTGPEVDHLVAALRVEVRRQDVIHPDGYPATRDGIRLAIATIGDERREARKAWRAGRCKCPTPRCNHHDWATVEQELLQLAAVTMRALRSIGDARGETWGCALLAEDVERLRAFNADLERLAGEKASDG